MISQGKSVKTYPGHYTFISAHPSRDGSGKVIPPAGCSVCPPLKVSPSMSISDTKFGSLCIVFFNRQNGIDLGFVGESWNSHYLQWNPKSMRRSVINMMVATSSLYFLSIIAAPTHITVLELILGFFCFIIFLLSQIYERAIFRLNDEGTIISTKGILDYNLEKRWEGLGLLSDWLLFPYSMWYLMATIKSYLPYHFISFHVM